MFYGKQVQAVPFYGLSISEWERAAPISQHLSRSLEMTREGDEWNHSLHLHLLPFAIKSEAELKFLLLFFGDEELRMWSFFFFNNNRPYILCEERLFLPARLEGMQGAFKE